MTTPRPPRDPDDDWEAFRQAALRGAGDQWGRENSEQIRRRLRRRRLVGALVGALIMALIISYFAHLGR